jgi:hypothetical protein
VRYEIAVSYRFTMNSALSGGSLTFYLSVNNEDFGPQFRILPSTPLGTRSVPIPVTSYIGLSTDVITFRFNSSVSLTANQFQSDVGRISISYRTM